MSACHLPHPHCITKSCSASCCCSSHNHAYSSCVLVHVSPAGSGVSVQLPQLRQPAALCEEAGPAAWGRWAAGECALLFACPPVCPRMPHQRSTQRPVRATHRTTADLTLCTRDWRRGKRFPFLAASHTRAHTPAAELNTARYTSDLSTNTTAHDIEGAR